MTEEMPGPVDFVLIEFPAGAGTEPVAESLMRLLDSGVVRLYDIALVRKTSVGEGFRLDLDGPLDDAGGGFGALAGAQSGLFDDNDIAQAAEALEPETSGLLLAYENAWAAPFVTAAHAAGGEVIASDRIPAQTLIDALELTETAS